jgi:hypothetical protein
VALEVPAQLGGQVLGFGGAAAVPAGENFAISA